MKRAILLMAVLTSVGFSSMAHAALISRGTDSLGNQLIYDTDLNITWYDYSNTKSNWQTQMDWASALDVNFGGTHYTDWRLPSTVDGPITRGSDGTTTAGYNITTSEMGHLYYTEFGNAGYCDTSGNCPNPAWGYGYNYSPFEHWSTDGYWSGTEHSLDTAWFYNFFVGGQDVNPKDSANIYGEPPYLYAMAVRNGDVFSARPEIDAAPVPEPGTWMLLGVGLVGLVTARRKLACFTM